MADTIQDTAAIRDLLFRMADDALIIAHRNSEWTGLGPMMEEDIAFSSIAQDKLGHASVLYEILADLGEANPDTLAFTRSEKEFRCCQLVEYPIGGYEFSLMRHLLFDLAEAIRYTMLEESLCEPLAKLARKVKGEIRYHLFHAITMVSQLAGNGTEESRAKMCSALADVFPLVLGIFEPSDYESELVADGIFAGEDALRSEWFVELVPILTKANLDIPDMASAVPAYGGRRGYHTEYLAPLLAEMTEVFRIDPSAEW